MGGNGVPLDVGQKRRLATRAQRQALRAMYTTCAHPQCWRPFSWCRIHHVVWWELGGDTDLANLLPLCDQHHHQVHEGGWSLSMTPDRIVTWRTPGGTVWFVGDTRNRPPATWDPPPDPPTAAGGPGGSPSDGNHPGGDCCGTTPSSARESGSRSSSRTSSRPGSPPTAPRTSPRTDPPNSPSQRPGTGPRTGPPVGPSRSDLAASVTAAPAPTLPDSVAGETTPSHPSVPRDADAAAEPSWLSGLAPHLRRRWRETRPNDPTLFDHDTEAAGP
ncbi:hypothetical protein BH23ACT3_BH23ACT3_17680 [soil metagenome]